MGVQQPKILHENATTGTSVGYDLLCQTAGGVRVDVKWGTSTTAGVVVIEHAPNSKYTGLWSVIATATWTVANSVDSYWLPPGCYSSIRTRITTTVTGNGVTTEVHANRGY